MSNDDHFADLHRPVCTGLWLPLDDDVANDRNFAVDSYPRSSFYFAFVPSALFVAIKLIPASLHIDWRQRVVITVCKCYIKGNQKGNIKCYARERANTKQPFWTVITFLTSVVY